MIEPAIAAMMGVLVLGMVVLVGAIICLFRQAVSKEEEFVRQIIELNSMLVIASAAQKDPVIPRQLAHYQGRANLPPERGTDMADVLAKFREHGMKGSSTPGPGQPTQKTQFRRKVGPPDPRVLQPESDPQQES